MLATQRKIDRALADIATRLDFPGALVPAVIPGVNDAASAAIN
jgi:hypothetical protein